MYGGGRLCEQEGLLGVSSRRLRATVLRTEEANAARRRLVFRAGGRARDDAPMAMPHASCSRRHERFCITN